MFSTTSGTLFTVVLTFNLLLVAVLFSSTVLTASFTDAPVISSKDYLYCFLLIFIKYISIKKDSGYEVNPPC